MPCGSLVRSSVRAMMSGSNLAWVSQMNSVRIDGLSIRKVTGLGLLLQAHGTVHALQTAKSPKSFFAIVETPPALKLEVHAHGALVRTEVEQRLGPVMLAVQATVEGFWRKELYRGCIPNSPIMVAHINIGPTATVDSRATLELWPLPGQRMKYLELVILGDERQLCWPYPTLGGRTLLSTKRHAYTQSFFGGLADPDVVIDAVVAFAPVVCRLIDDIGRL